jgi:hypothetical protein
METTGGKLNPEIWAEIGRKWITGVTPSHLSRQYGVTRRAITQAAERYGWGRLPEHEIHAATQAKLHGIEYVAAQVTAPATRAKIIDEAADARARLIRKHQRDWDALYLIRADAYLILRGQNPKVIADAQKTDGGATMMVRDLEFKDMKDRVSFARKLIEIFEADVRALSAAQEGERRANGFDYKAQQQVDAKDETAERERKRLMASLVQTASAIKAMQVQKQTESA